MIIADKVGITSIRSTIFPLIFQNNILIPNGSSSSKFPSFVETCFSHFCKTFFNHGSKALCTGVGSNMNRRKKMKAEGEK